MATFLNKKPVKKTAPWLNLPKTTNQRLEELEARVAALENNA